MRCILRQQNYIILNQTLGYRSVKGYNGWSQLAILMVFLGVGFVLTAIVQMVIVMQLVPVGTPLAQIPDLMLDELAKPEHVFYARLIQIAGTFTLFFIPTIAFTLVVNGKQFWWLGMNRYLGVKQVVIGFLVIFFANLMASPLAEISKALISHFPSFDQFAANLEREYNKQVSLLSNLHSWKEFFVAVFIIAFFPALFEELFFRGALQQLLVKWWKNAFLAILVSSVLFSLVHSSAYLFASRVILGLALGGIFYYTKNLWVNIIAHFANNFVALCQMFYIGRQGKPVEPDKIENGIEWWGGIIALVLIVFLFRLLIHFSKRYKEKIEARESALIESHRNNNSIFQQ